MAIKKICNWPDYNKSLVKRGGIIFTFTENSLDNFYYCDAKKRGGIKIYSNYMFEFLFTIKIIFRLSWRSTIGFAMGLLQKAFPGQAISVPDYAHASRESAKLNLKIKQYKPKDLVGMEIAFDSTGVNIYSASDWHLRQYGRKNQHRQAAQWKKIHVALDLNNMQIIAIKLTDSTVNDCEVVAEMCASIDGKVKSVRADGAYDVRELYRVFDEKFRAKIMIPVDKIAKMQDELKSKPKIKKDYLKQRDEQIKVIRQSENFEEGLKVWKMQTGYHQRSLIEACMFRLKKILGNHLQGRTSQMRANEVIMKANILNQMASYGRAKYYSNEYNVVAGAVYEKECVG